LKFLQDKKIFAYIDTKFAGLQQRLEQVGSFGRRACIEFTRWFAPTYLNILDEEVK
jgi:hypothetical protein